MKYLYIFIFHLFLLSSCSKDKDDAVAPSTASQIEGKWIIHKSTIDFIKDGQKQQSQAEIRDDEVSFNGSTFTSEYKV